MSSFSIPITPKDIDSLLFRIKKFEYNKYKIEHPIVKGFLRVANMPTNIFKIKDEALVRIPNNMNIPTNAKYLISYQGIVGFDNRGEKKKSKQPWRREYINSKPKQDLFSYINIEQTSEPWNEFVIQGENPILVRTKTILTNAFLYIDYYNNQEDPIIHALHNTSISISEEPNAEIGLE